jgi:hypothetical protein
MVEERYPFGPERSASMVDLSRSQGERVDRDGAFNSRRGPGEG